MDVMTFAKKVYRRLRSMAVSWGMKLVAPVRRHRAFQQLKNGIGAQPIKLHLGCGHIRIPGFLNVDILDSSAVDLQDDISKLNKVPDNSVDLIYACHVLEHFSHVEALAVLKRWHEVLKPGGELRISVPDTDSNAGKLPLDRPYLRWARRSLRFS